MLMVMEYCEYGSLQDYLRSEPNIPDETKDRFALDAALGLEYLADRGKLAANPWYRTLTRVFRHCAP